MRTTVDKGNIADLKTLEAENSKKYYAKVYLERRYWDAGDSEYKWAEALEITDKIKSFGKINLEQDPVLGQWKISNSSISVMSDNREFGREGAIWNPDGDEVGGTVYVPDYSFITFEIGCVDDGGDKHGIDIFTGVLAKDSIDEGDLHKEVCKMKIRGLGELVDSYSAEDLPDNQITGETLVDLGGNEYRTAQKGVGIIKKVYDGTTPLTEGVDYTVSNLNDVDNYATVQLEEAPGGIITSDYVYWYQNKTIEFLAEKILAHAGFDANNRNIQNVTFPDIIENSEIYNTKADWDGGTFNDTETVAGEDKLYSGSDFAFLRKDGEFNYASGGYPQPHIAQKFKLLLDSEQYSNIYIYIPYYAEFGYGVSIYSHDAVNDEPDVAIRDLGTVYPYSSSHLSYNKKTFYENLNLSKDTWYWIVVNSRDFDEALYYETNKEGDEHYAEGKLVIDEAGDSNWTEIENKSYMFAIQTFKEGIGHWTSDTMNLTSDITGFGNLIINKSNILNINNLRIYIRTQDVDSGWPIFDFNDRGPWSEVVDGIVYEEPRQYARIVIFNIETDYSFIIPPGIIEEKDVIIPYPNYISKMELEYYSESFLISLADFTGMSDWDALKKLTSMADYALGFEKKAAFLRKKVLLDTSGEPEPAKIINKNTQELNKIKEFSDDWSRIINTVKVTHGDVTHIIDSETEGEAEPNSINRFGRKELSLDFGGILARLPDGTITKNIARLYWNRYHESEYGNKVRKILKANTDLMLLLQLGDRIQNQDLAYILRLLKYTSGLSYTENLRYGYQDYYNLDYYIIKFSIDIDKIRDGGMELTLLEV